MRSVIFFLLAADLPISGMCSSTVNGKPLSCVQYHALDAEALKAKSLACRDSAHDKSLKRRWAQTERCAPPVVGTCRVSTTDPASADASLRLVAEYFYYRPDLDASESRCRALAQGGQSAAWTAAK